MLERLLHALMRRPLMLGLALLVLVVFGMRGWMRMPVDLLPRLDVPVVNVITHLTGASSEDIDLLVTRPLAARMQGIQGVHSVVSTSAQGISRISVQFDWGTKVSDARQLVQARLSRLAPVLPPGARFRLENIGTTLQQVAGYVITGPGDPVMLSNAVRYRLAPRLLNTDGVSFVDVLGGEQRAWIVSLKPQSLARLHLRIAAVADALGRANRIQVAGFLSRGGRELLVRGDGRFMRLEELRKFAIAKLAGRPVLLADVADIHAGRAPRHYIVHGDGKPAIALLVRKQPGASSLAVVHAIDANMARLRSLLPRGTKIRQFYDQSEVIAAAKREISRDLILAAALVGLVLYAFMGAAWPTFVVALTIPVILLTTLAGMNAMGLSLNVVTLTALALVIGMIVDDSIIVAENIHRHARSAVRMPAAGIRGALEISGPDASGTFTTMAAFLPLLFIGGLAKQFLGPFGWTVSLALLASLVVSLTLVPVLMAVRNGRTKRHDPVGIGRLDRYLQKVLTSSLQHRPAIFLLVTVLVAGALILGASGEARLLPPMDEGSILVEYIMPPGTSLSESNRIGEQLERLARRHPDVAGVYRRTGSPISGYQIEGVNRGEMVIKLKDRDKRSHGAAAIMADMKRRFARFSGMAFLYHQPTQEKMDESLSGLPAMFGVSIFGDNADTLTRLAANVESMLNRDPAISNIVNNTKVHGSQLSVHIQHALSARYGLNSSDIFTVLRASGLGVEAGRVIHGQEIIPILLRLSGGDFGRPDTIGNLPVVTPDGGWIPLRRVADIEQSTVPAVITRLNGRREITLLAEVDGSLVAAARRVQARLATLHLPAGYSAAVTGQYMSLRHTLVQLALISTFAMLLIYLIMVLQFSSWRQPLAVLLAVPLALAGGLIALLLTGQGLDISVGMAALTLIGVAVNNGIVLVDFANRHTRAGMDALAAWRAAISVRLRPILLTAVTTIAALLPVAFGVSGTSEVFRPFAITVIGGLTTALFGSLLFIPLMLASNRSSLESGDHFHADVLE